MGITWAILFTCIFNNYAMSLSMGTVSAILLTCNVLFVLKGSLSTDIIFVMF